ncbi:Gfo/Idh/MocA family protein [Romboutsia sp. 1001713B170207_170306_H8]|uniref:Gfo/Idh/MocA family protein n=1 Tax=Romboutsia sp. 1001713B170207_170306_H8 TaxID=2787112 RepID=UPI000822DCD8|nr:Gfo/Idh/MocA family oxidoreductase [Romboutsia sp. 1001713B170207_170306_H8]SCH03165.1 Uncharacterized oxidoreductase ydgJ [uncultured Clostridium sp.]
MKKVKVAVVGAGVRGTYAYAPYIFENQEVCEIVAVAETKKGRRDLFSKKYNLKEENVFESAEELFEKEKIADAIIIATNDDRHFNLAKLALEKGYHVLLEKPMANSLDGLVHIKELAEKYTDKVFMTCHVLRYTEFFKKLKEIIDSKELGALVSIQHNENIGYFHFAHSYVRGNWRNSSDTGPLMLTKSCHDLDILLYLTGSKCRKIASFGSLKHFNSDNFKLTMSESCYRCSEEENCPYSCKKIYLENERMMNNAVHINPTKENLDTILKKGPYGRCVYRCDNNVVDNMVSIIEFENDVTATFNLSAFTKECTRTIKLMFTHGEVGGNFKENEIRIKKFGDIKEEVLKLGKNDLSHGGGDKNLIKHFIDLIINEKIDNSINESIESHIMAFASEYSRVSEQVIYIDEFLKDAIDMTSEIEDTLF